MIDQQIYALQQQEVENATFNSQNFVREGNSRAVNAIKSNILTRNFVGPARMQSLLQEVNEIETSLESPPLIVVVLGDTGAGKSSTLNALIGERSILPTNGMRACMASLIEISYNYNRGAPFRAVVELMSRQDWETELDTLLHDMTLRSDAEANLPRTPDADSPAGIAPAKVKLVYGVASVATVGDFNDMRRVGSRVTRALGKNREFEGRDASSFRRQLEEYAVSSDATYGESFWPVVKKIRIFGRWPVPKSGCILVDAPGIRDDNSARDGIVRGYLKAAGMILIVSRIQRAVNDKAARTLLSESFWRQVVMDGRHASASLAFVCTQVDVLNRVELERNLKLEETATLRECALARNKYSTKRIQADYVAGLREVMMAAADAEGDGEVDDADMERLQHVSLPVFVSLRSSISGLLDCCEICRRAFRTFWRRAFPRFKISLLFHDSHAAGQIAVCDRQNC